MKRWEFFNFWQLVVKAKYRPSCTFARAELNIKTCDGWDRNTSVPAVLMGKRHRFYSLTSYWTVFKIWCQDWSSLQVVTESSQSPSVFAENERCYYSLNVPSLSISVSPLLCWPPTLIIPAFFGFQIFFLFSPASVNKNEIFQSANMSFPVSEVFKRSNLKLYKPTPSDRCFELN